MRRRRRLITDIAAVFLVVLPVLAAPGATADAAVTGLTDCRFSRAQVFDVQWNPGLDGNTLLRASSFALPYSSHEPGGRLSLAQMADDDTFEFYENGADIGFRQYAADGTLIRTLHLSGTFTAVGDDFIFYNGAGSWGTLITTGEGYAYGASASLPVTDADVSLAEALA